MAGATFSRLKNWIAEILNYADLNAEIDNILNNLGPSGVDDYSANATQMRLTTDGGESGSESLATSLAGEIERLRFAIKEIKGSGVSYWYQSSTTTLSELASALGSGVVPNRISSGRMRTGSSQPIFLVPNGAAKTVTAKGATTNLVYSIASTQYTISSDVSVTGLTAAPSSNNTTLVNMPSLAANEWTKRAGEFGTTIQVDAMGSNISNLSGQLAGFKLAGAATEYFIARVDSATQLSNAMRGYFFDSTDAPVKRTTFTDNDTITLMKLTWVYAKTDGTLTVGYTNPVVATTQPTSPAIGDFWFDLTNNVWKQFDLTSAYVTASATLIGVCLQDATNTVAARSFDFFKNYATTATGNVERASATACIFRGIDGEVSIYGTIQKFAPDRLTWSTATNFDSGVSEAASTPYYLYVTEAGLPVISDIAPYDRSADLKGLYHPHHAWRCMGSVYNNSAQDFVACINYQDTSATNYKFTTEVAGSALTIKMFANPLSRMAISSNNTTDVVTHAQIPCVIQIVVPSGASLGLTAGTPGYIYGYIVVGNSNPELFVSTLWRDCAALVTTTAITAGAVTSGLFSTSAQTSMPARLLARFVYATVPNGTYSAVPDSVSLLPAALAGPIREFRAATSSVKTPGATGQYMAMTGNSVILTPGSWELTGSCLFSNSGAPAYTAYQLFWALANGADSGTPPTSIQSALDAGSEGIFMTIASQSSFDVPANSVRITVTTATTVYLVPLATLTTAANARVTTYVQAERVA